MKDTQNGYNEILVPSVSKDESITRFLAEHENILRMVEDTFPVKVFARGNLLSITSLSGEDDVLVKRLDSLLTQFAEAVASGQKLSTAELRYGFNQIREGKDINLKSLYNEVVCVTNRGRAVRPYTAGQKEYACAVDDNDITFAIGPAGTGKTYLAAAMAVSHLKAGKVSRLVLVRPVVEAGERLGYLPGDLTDKIEPYLRPLYDAFYDLLPSEKFNRYFERGVIELAPLAYMRGRTLNDSFIILDEAQNTTAEQMKMFLTRLGFGSKAVITGDVTQVDLPSGKESGLKLVREILKDIPKIAFVELKSHDVVRHEIVQRIVRAYEEHDRRRKEKDSN